MKIELTADQAAAFKRGESITLTPPKPKPVETTALYINNNGMVRLIHERDGKPYEQRVIVWGKDWEGKYNVASYNPEKERFYGISEKDVEGNRRIALP